MSKKKKKRTDNKPNQTVQSAEVVSENQDAAAAETVEAEKAETKSEKTESAEGKKASKGKPARTVRTIQFENKMSETKIFLILSFLVPFLIMGFMFARAKIHPFGDRQVLYSDCKQQYLPFLKEFQRKLKSGDSMYYTWHSGMGTNFLAMIGYYISSPLNLLTLIVPAKYIREALAVFIMIKVGCASLFTAIFLKHVYRRNDISLVAFGCCYAFCDFIMGYYWNTIWLDSVALLPLVALGVYCVVNERKYKLYVISLALAFLSSYYIGYMICVFVVLWFIVQSVIKKFKLEDFCADILRMALYSGIALAMTLPVTFVSYVQLSNTVGTDDSFPDKLEFYNNFMELLSNLFSFHEPTTMEGLPNIGTGVFCILMLVIFIRSKDILRSEKISMLVLLGFLFVSLNVNSLDYIWHGFHFPNLIPYRFAFLFSFTFVVIAYRAFTVFAQIDKKDIIGMCIITIIMVCITVFYLDRKAIIGSLIVAAVYIIFMTLYELDLLTRGMLIMFTSLVIIAEMCFQASIGVNTVGTTSYNDYPAKEEEVTELLKYAEKQSGDDLYRIDQTTYSTKNDGMIYGYNSAGQFSSTSYKTLIDFTADFGIISKRSSFQYMLTSPVISMLLNEKYIIARDGYTADESSLTQVQKASDNEAALFENKYYLPIGYMADNSVMDADLDQPTVFEAQNEVFRKLTGVDDDVYTLLSPSAFNCKNIEHEKESDGLFLYTITDGESSGEIKITYTATKSGMLYAWTNIKSSDDVHVKSANINHSYKVEAQRYIFPIGYYKKGEVAVISVDAEKRGNNRICVAQLNDEVMEKGYAALNDETLSVTNHGSSVIEGKINVNEDGLFMTSVPYEKGWKLYVDGNAVDTKEVLGAFTGADLTKGEHTIKLTYKPEGFTVGLIAGIAALLLFIFLWVNDSLKAKGKELVKFI